MSGEIRGFEAWSAQGYFKYNAEITHYSGTQA